VGVTHYPALHLNLTGLNEGVSGLSSLPQKFETELPSSCHTTVEIIKHFVILVKFLTL